MLKKFDPLIFLMSLGAGGISVIPFAFFQYTFEHGKGLIQLSQIDHSVLPFFDDVLFRSLEGVMIVFSLIHIVLSLILAVHLIKWKKEDYLELEANPLKNSALLAPFISLVMTMNVFIGPVRFFIPLFADNLQMMMLPALIAWAAIWLVLMLKVISLLKISFEKSFDVNKISFGWLLYPFALGMLTVTGTGIAALAADSSIAHSAAFLSIVSGTMGAFLLIVKLVAIFKSHFASTEMPAKQEFSSWLL